MVYLAACIVVFIALLPVLGLFMNLLTLGSMFVRDVREERESEKT